MSFHCQWFAAGMAPEYYPTLSYYGMLWIDRDNGIAIPKRDPYKGKWGETATTSLPLEDDNEMPVAVDMAWLSLTEKRFYSIGTELPTDRLTELFSLTDPDSSIPLFKYIVVGMAPYGRLAVWARGDRKSTLVTWLTGEHDEVPMQDFVPYSPEMTLEQLCETYINKDSRVRENLRVNGLPDKRLFDRLMRQYRYRYVPLFEHWHEGEDDPAKQWTPWENDDPKRPVPQSIEQSLTDGTHDKMRDDSLLRHHEAGAPHRLAVRWTMGKSEWTAYVWIDAEASALVFERFCGVHRDLPFDVLLRFDPMANHYEVSLFRHGMRQPQALPADIVEILVFKDQLERYRSNNYSQPSGAWLW